MVAIHEMKQVLWVETPHGDGIVLLVMDYGPHENTIWVVANEKTREIKHYNSTQVRLCWNHTMFQHLFTDPNINPQEPENGDQS
jgi:hypothetical protein